MECMLDFKFYYRAFQLADVFIVPKLTQAPIDCIWACPTEFIREGDSAKEGWHYNLNCQGVFSAMCQSLPDSFSSRKLARRLNVFATSLFERVSLSRKYASRIATISEFIDRLFLVALLRNLSAIVSSRRTVCWYKYFITCISRAFVNTNKFGLCFTAV